MDKNVAKGVVAIAVEIGAAAAKMAEEAVSGLAESASKQPAWTRAGALDGVFSYAKAAAHMEHPDAVALRIPPLGSPSSRQVEAGLSIMKHADSLMAGESAIGLAANDRVWSKTDAVRGVSAYLEGHIQRLGIRDPKLLEAEFGNKLNQHDINAALTIIRRSDSATAGENLIKTDPHLVDSISSLVSQGRFSTYDHAFSSLKRSSDVTVSSEGAKNAINSMLESVGPERRATPVSEFFTRDMKAAGFTPAQMTDARITAGAYRLFQEDPGMMGNAAIAARIAGRVDRPTTETVGRMLNGGWTPEKITRTDLQTAQILRRYDSGFPTPSYIDAIRGHRAFSPSATESFAKPVLDDIVIPKLQNQLRFSQSH